MAPEGRGGLKRDLRSDGGGEVGTEPGRSGPGAPRPERGGGRRSSWGGAGRAGLTTGRDRKAGEEDEPEGLTGQ